MSDFMPIAVAGETWFARSLATVAEDLPACRPTVFFAVPRVWEKLREGIEDHVRTQALPGPGGSGALHRPRAAQWLPNRTGRRCPVAIALYGVLDRTLGATIRHSSASTEPAS